MEIARTTLSSKLVLYEKEHFAKLAVDAVLRLKGSDNLDYIQLLKKPGGQLGDSYLAEGFVLDKKIGIGQPKRLEKAKACAGVHCPPPRHRADARRTASRRWRIPRRSWSRTRPWTRTRSRFMGRA